MGAWTPTPQIWIDGAQYTGYVDFNITFTRGQDAVWDSPSPGSGSVQLLFMDTPAIPAKIGSNITIYANTSGGTYAVCNVGYVSDMAVNAVAYGDAGSVWELSITFVGAMSLIQNQTYYTATDTTSDTATALNNILNAVDSTSWEELDPTLTWTNARPVAWSAWDPVIFSASVSGTGPSVTVPAGYRNAWDDFTTLALGASGIVQESPSGGVGVLIALVPLGFTPAANTLNTDVSAGNTVTTMRNRVTVNDYLNAEAAYRADDVSVYTYGARETTISTLLNNALDAANLAANIVNGLSDATMALTGFSIDLTNPNVIDADRDSWLQTVTYGTGWTLTGLPAALGSLDVITTRATVNMTKQATILNIQCAPASQLFSSITWNQVPIGYTWTSYGTAYPTQKWSDL